MHLKKKSSREGVGSRADSTWQLVALVRMVPEWGGRPARATPTVFSNEFLIPHKSRFKGKCPIFYAVVPMQSILIVEDDLRLANLLRSGIEEAGYSTLLAFDGEMALRLIQNGNVDLVVSDIILPGISGLDLCKKIRSVRPETAILMLTALGTTDDKLEGFDAGADDYMTKPFDFRELLARIGVLLKRRGTSSSLQAKTQIFCSMAT